MANLVEELRRIARETSASQAKSNVALFAKSEKKAIDSVLSEEEQEKILKEVKEDRPFLPDIGKMLEYIGRPGHAVAGGLKESYKRGPEYFAKGFMQGLKGETKNTARDIIKEISPKTMRHIEENTGFRILGVDADSASIPLFIADMVIDPVSWMPFGWLTKGTKAVATKASKSMLAAATHLAPEATAKALKTFDRLMEFHVNPKFNIRAIFEKYGLTKGFEKVRVSKNVATAKSDALISAMRAAGISTKEESIAFNKGMQSISDEVGEYFAKHKADELGLTVQEMTMLDDFDRVAAKITDLEKGTFIGKAGELEASQASLTELREVMAKMVGEIKKSRTSGIVSKILERRGLKNEAATIAKVEASATMSVAQKRLEFVKDRYKELSGIIKEQRTNLDKFLKGEIGSAGKQLNLEIASTQKALKAMTDNLNSAVLGQGSIDQKNVRAMLDFVARRINSLDKYSLDASKNIARTSTQMARRSAESLTKLKAYAAKWQEIMAKDAITGRASLIRKESKAIIGELEAASKGMHKELNVFRKLQSQEIVSLAKKGRAASVLDRQAIDAFKKESSDLDRWQKHIDKMHTSEKVMFEVTKSKVSKFAANRAESIHNVLKALQKGSLTSKVVQDWHVKETAIAEAAMKKHLPKEMWDAARIARGVLNDYRIELSKGPKPLLSGFIPGYFPRAMSEESLKKISSAMPMFRATGGRPLLYSRKFRTNAAAEQWALENGAKFEDDGLAVLADYVYGVEMKKAKHLLENEVMGRFGLKSTNELPKNIAEREAFNNLKEQIFYLYSGGRTRFNNPTTRSIGSVYGKLMNSTKAALTIFNPAYLMRNVASQPFLMATATGIGEVFRVSNYVDGALMAAGKTGKMTRKVGNVVEALDYKTVQKAIEDAGLLASSWSRGDIKRSRDFVFRRYKNTDPRKWVSYVAQANQVTDDFGRMAAVSAHWKQGKTLEEAIELSRKSMIDYNLVNSPFDSAMQGLLGFYSFTRRNVPNQIRALLDDPKQYSMLSRVMEKISNREALTDEEAESLNQYESNTLKMLGESIDGVRHIYTLGFHPVEDAYSTLNTVLSWDTGALKSRLNPLATTFLDFYYGEDSFTGKDFGNYLPAKYTETIKGPLRKALGLTEVERPKYRNGEEVGTETVLVGKPWAVALVRKVPWYSRQLSDVSELIKKSKDGAPGEAAVGYLLGIKGKDVDVAQRNKFMSLAQKEAVRNAAKAKGAKELRLITMPKKKKK